MWTNNMLKQNAWNSLKTYYWTAFGVTILTAILGGNGSINFYNNTDNSSTEYAYGTDTTFTSMGSERIIGFMIGFLIAFIIVTCIGLAIYAFLGGIIRCGECKFFRHARTGDVNFGYLFDSFQGGRYKKTAKVMFNTQLQIFLYTLLLIIPGIFKTYEYYLVPYLMSENADLSAKRAQEISKQTMNGEKFKLFSLQLSFIGWYLLGLLACAIGAIFVNPYYEATMAEFYTCMRAKMISYSITSEEELTGYYNNFDGPYDNNNYQNYNQPYNNNPYNNNNYQNYNQPYNSNPYDNNNYNNNNYQNYNQPYNSNANNSNNYNMPNHNSNSNHVNLDKNENNNNNDYFQNY